MDSASIGLVSRSASRHFPILFGFAPNICQLGGEMWLDKPSKESPGAAVALWGSSIPTLFALLWARACRFGTIAAAAAAAS